MGRNIVRLCNEPGTLDTTELLVEDLASPRSGVWTVAFQLLRFCRRSVLFDCALSSSSKGPDDRTSRHKDDALVHRRVEANGLGQTL